MIRLRFVEGIYLDSKIIRWNTRCRWSHVECLPIRPIACTWGAMLIGGVAERGMEDRRYKKAATQIWEIQTPLSIEIQFYDFIRSQLGKPYDWRAIASFGLGERDWRNANSWFCSELIARGLEKIGFLNLPLDQPIQRITPRDVWILLCALKLGNSVFARGTNVIERVL